jgi:hypothetical protein
LARQSRRAEPLALLGCHALPALGHAPPKTGAKAAAAKTAEQDPAESQQSQSLPEADLGPAEQTRQEPVPQAQHDFAANRDEGHDRQRGQNKDPFPSHVVLLNGS